ncbi:ComEC/Rec2 family competence protein [Desulfocicer niacini]
MEIKIFDVSHGFCAYLIADNGNIMLFDCGHNEKTDFRPSVYLPRKGCTGIEHLIIHNFDQDHVSDLHNLLRVLPIQLFFRNRSITPETLSRIKQISGPITSAMQAAIDLHAEYVHGESDPPVFPHIQFECFCNSYPTFTDTNNLSLVAFVHYDGMGIIFPGDLERAGWKELLEVPSFRDNLKKVDIFVASHHGRESGYCQEVFDYCNPDIIIISDKEIVHETQKNKYKQHAIGVPWNGGPERRYVLTTRSDGLITITKQVGLGYQISI